MMSAPVLTSGLSLLAAGAALAWGWRTRRALRHSRIEAAGARLAAEERAELQALRVARDAWQGQYRLLQAQAHETQRELASLSYSVSHDLRAPLRGIDGFSQALIEDYGHCLDATAQDYLRRVRANAVQMSALIDALLTLSHVARAPFHAEAVDASALARQLAAELSARDPARRARWDIPAGITVHGDRELLAAALRQLLANAWKFTATRPEAHIAFRALAPDPAHPAGSVYQVRDNGVGFDPQYAGKLFGAFQRLHGPEEFPGGQGIGLALVQRIVRRHGGSIRAHAVPEQGAVFSFTLAGATGDQTESGAPELAADLAPAPAAAGGTAVASFSKTTTV